jgi:hypothetical protein
LFQFELQKERKKMNLWLIPSTIPILSTPHHHHHHHLHLPIIPTKLSLHNTLLATTLSFGFFFSSLPSSASALQPPSLPIPLSPSTETCRDVDLPDVILPTAPEVVTNEGLVQEAWQIVNDDFLDTGRNRWSQDTWQVISMFKPFQPISKFWILFFMLD